MECKYECPPLLLKICCYSCDRKDRCRHSCVDTTATCNGKKVVNQSEREDFFENSVDFLEGKT